MLKEELALIPFKECVGKELYEMYQDIPKEEIDALFKEGKFKKGHYMMFNDYLQYKNENKS